MLKRIETKDRIPDFIEGVKRGDERLMGFGHRVYKNYDPRAKIIKKATDDVFEVTGTNPLLDIASSSSGSRSRTTTSSSASSTRTSTSTGPHLRGAGPAGRDVPGHVRDRAHERLDRPVARDGAGQGAEDRPPAADLHGRARRDYVPVEQRQMGRALGDAANTAGGPTVGVDLRLAEDRPLVVRPIRPEDKALLQAGLRMASPESIRRRFLAAKPRLTGASCAT